MTVSGDATFSITIGFEELARGPRPSKRVPRNSKFLVECVGGVGRDSSLQVIDDVSGDRINQASIFPFPQLFVFTNLILICTDTKIYELVNGTPTLRLTVSPGTIWSAVDFFDYIYMSNGKVAVIRSATSKLWSVSATLPLAGSIVDYNGQVMISSPDVIQRWDYTVQLDPILLTTSIIGSKS
jgi:hypothetical protein